MWYVCSAIYKAIFDFDHNGIAFKRNIWANYELYLWILTSAFLTQNISYCDKHYKIGVTKTNMNCCKLRMINWEVLSISFYDMTVFQILFFRFAWTSLHNITVISFVLHLTSDIVISIGTVPINSQQSKIRLCFRYGAYDDCFSWCLRMWNTDAFRTHHSLITI